MWTPRRIVMLVCGIVLFASSYVSYAHTFLGVIDGLPALPDSCRRAVGGTAISQESKPRSGLSQLETKIMAAFGPGCEELKRPIRFEMHSRNMVISAGDFKPTDDGKKIYLAPLSVAIFGKETGDGRGPEINTIRCKEAYLTLNKPAKNPTELNDRKITQAMLIDDILIVNNHRTPERFDDLEVSISKGPLYYDEIKQLIWTDDSVHLVDKQSTPPTDVRGKGMDITLIAESSPVANAKKISGIKQIILREDVTMHLYPDSSDGFPGMSQNNTAQGTADVNRAAANFVGPMMPPAKSHVIITTPGRFLYEMNKDHDLATFTVPWITNPGGSSWLGRRLWLPASGDVKVVRQSPRLSAADPILIDQLICEKLILRLSRREEGKNGQTNNSSTSGSGGTLENGMTIETAHATGKGEIGVIITSDAEHLVAEGDEMNYDAATQITILSGEKGMIATKEDGSDKTIIQAPACLQIRQYPADKKTKAWQSIVGTGPGRIDVYDIKVKPEKKKLSATWNDMLTSTKDNSKELDGVKDLLILTGAARFQDELQDQSLRGEILKVWLQSNDKEKASPPGSSSSSMKPYIVEATTNVDSRSKDLLIHDSGHLVIRFIDEPELTMLPDPLLGPKPQLGIATPTVGTTVSRVVTPGEMEPAPLPKTKPVENSGSIANPPIPNNATTNPMPLAKVEPKPAPAPNPMDLSARSIEAWVRRRGERNVLKKMRADGSVQVHQDPDPTKQDSKGVFIEGYALTMERIFETDAFPVEGEIEYYDLHVLGDMAVLVLDKIFITGPEVNINQLTNRCTVHGGGAMRMESTSTLGGQPMEKPVPLTVYWDESMHFSGDGKIAEFFGGSKGGVQAEQQNAHLVGQSMQVNFDRRISLREGNKSEQPARVKNLNVTKNVVIEDYTYDERKNLLKFQQINAPNVRQNSLESDDDKPVARGQPQPNPGNEIRAMGPGVLRILHARERGNGALSDARGINRAGQTKNCLRSHGQIQGQG